MFVFTSLSDRDKFTTAKGGDRCRVGTAKYIYSETRGWLEMVNILSFENESALSACSCENCGCSP